ncbi:hypothetical protein C7474_2365 [Microbacterium telephonicum]|uniref:Uncharacterized protein n=2 Tax=Microbacterium telephonicum TaxID=1714841 RepID=A0A498C4R9_9MICO|nr:hypothetical protein C7474_2365 [Microbacterium telephonicum]
MIGAWAVLSAVLVAQPALAVPTAVGDVSSSVSASLDASVADAAIVKAAPVVGFDPGNIISDALFYDSGAMSAAEIQTFLDQKIGSCQNGRCLNVLTVEFSDRARFVSQTTGQLVCDAIKGGRMRASEAIYRAQVACGISAKVILVTLQKEQGLVTSKAPTDWNLSAAMGASCPDNAPCDPAFSGTGPQIMKGTQQLKAYKATAFGRQPGVHFITYSPKAACAGQGTNVNVVNYATAALYNYTPYQPNPSALAAGFGEGDTCASYGNRNFYNYYTLWFGSTQNVDADRAPFGGYNIVVERGQITVQGWAIDPDEQTTALSVSLTVDGVANWGTFTANSSRPDVGAAYPAAGNNHGMNGVFEIDGGEHTVCVTVKNIGRGQDANFGCSTISVTTASPYGGTSAEAVPGGVRVTGWTLDTDTKDALAVHIYLDDSVSAHVANAYRPDVAKVFPGFGDFHGLDVTIPAAVGDHKVCAYGINVGRGSNALIGCHDVTVVAKGDPVGRMTAVAQAGGVRVTGWAHDPNDGSKSVGVHVYADGKAVASTTADLARTDLTDAYPGVGPNHGYDVSAKLPAGTKQVCTYGINIGLGTNALLSCTSVTVMSGSPFGGIDTTLESDGVRLRGWTIDPDTQEPIAVHVYIDGQAQAITANTSRPDVGRVYPGYGALHGIDALLNVSPGSHQLCAYGINVGAGSNNLLGCTNFVVPSRSPFGGTDVTVVPGGVQLRGWTIDPDVVEPIDVHVYVDGRAVAVLTANSPRPDVARAYPGYGPSHGIDAKISMPPGSHQICSYGINRGPGENALLACQSITTTN